MIKLFWSMCRLVGCLLLLAACGLVMAAIYQLHHGWQLLSVQTASMRPVLNTGDAVLVGPTGHRLRVGDVITYRTNGSRPVRITHRVVAIDTIKNFVTTKGDANLRADAPVVVSQVEGRVYHSLPLAGHLVDLVRRPVGLAGLIFLPAVVVILSETRRLAATIRRQRYRLSA